MASAASFENATQSSEPGVATHIDFTLRRVNIGHALDPSYSCKTTAVVLASLYASAMTLAKFEGKVLAQFIPLLLITLIVSVPIFLYNGGTIMRRSMKDQSKWALQCLIGDPILEAFNTIKSVPLQSFLLVSFMGELSKLVGSMYTIAVAATIIALYKTAAACKRKGGFKKAFGECGLCCAISFCGGMK